MHRTPDFARLRWNAHRFLCTHRNTPVPFPSSGKDTQAISSALVLSHDNPIAQSQIYPYFFYRRELLARYGVSFREMDAAAFMHTPRGHTDKADIVLLQPWFTEEDQGIERMLSAIRERCRPERVVFLDSFAPTDLRFASTVVDYIDVYVKKHILKDRSKYSEWTFGDTNLTSYLSQRYELELPKRHFDVPKGFLDKLVVGPSFVTADYLLNGFMQDSHRHGTDKYDVHARLGRTGLEFYERLRQSALDAITDLEGISMLTEFGVSTRKYLRELSHSRVCYSPFGYGEVAWRDFESVLYGSLLMKQDSSHLETDPDIYLAGETYVPVNWDFSDVEEKLRYYLKHDDERHRIVQNAFNLLHEYVTSNRFVEQMKPLFAG